MKRIFCLLIILLTFHPVFAQKTGYTSNNGVSQSQVDSSKLKKFPTKVSGVVPATGNAAAFRNKIVEHVDSTIYFVDFQGNASVIGSLKLGGTGGATQIKKYTEGSPTIADTATKAFQQYGTAYSYYDSSANALIKLNRNLYVKDFGAKGDGTTNDRAAFITDDAVTGKIYVGVGNYVIASNLTINNPLELEKGAVFIVNNGVTLTLNGYISTDNRFQIFNCVGSGTVIFGKMSASVVRPEWFGAITSDLTDDYTAIQKAVDVAGVSNGTVTFSNGIYLINSTITPYSNLTLQGEKGSLIKFNNSVAGLSTIRTNTGVNNLTIDGIGFDGSINYPVTDFVNPSSVSDQYCIFLIGCNNVIIKNCSFNQFTRSSITITPASLACSNFSILNNSFTKGGYTSCSINILSGGVLLQNIKIIGNTLDITGPQGYTDASDDNFGSSKDAIQVNTTDFVLISNNTVKNSCGFGIRVEQSTRVTVSNNVIENAGQGGITFYKFTTNCVCTGNVIKKFGRIPPANAARNFGGVYYLATEYITSTPTNPSTDSRFIVYPYALTNVTVGTIRTYTAGVSLLPHRGFAAISVTQQATDVQIIGNICEGITTQTGGKYDYSSDYGYTPVHSTNAGTDNNGINCTVSANKFSNTISYHIYQPKFMNPSISNANNGGKVAFNLIEGTTNLIENVDVNSSFQAAVTFSTITTNRDINVNTVEIGLGLNDVPSNIKVGKFALAQNTSGSFNVAIGQLALYSNTTGGFNTALGANTLQQNTTTSGNTGIGYNALNATISSDNTAVGTAALQTNTTGIRNVGIGRSALAASNSASFNTAVGYLAGGISTGGQNTFVGYQSGNVNTVGTSNTTIGFFADVASNNLTNATALGNQAVVAASNSFVLGGTGANKVAVGINTTTPQYRMHVNAKTGSIGNPLLLEGLLQSTDINDSIVVSENGLLKRATPTYFVTAACASGVTTLGTVTAASTGLLNINYGKTITNPQIMVNVESDGTQILNYWSSNVTTTSFREYVNNGNAITDATKVKIHWRVCPNNGIGY